MADHSDLDNAALLPTFLIGGAPRSGTTFLAHLLDHHPDLFMAKPLVPEPKVCMTPAADGIQGYRRRYAALFAEAGARSARGEKTSYYFENEDALARIKATLPEPRFVFILREPVARAYSNYLWSTQNGLEQLSFAEAVTLDGRRPSPLPPEKEYVRPFDYLRRSRYGELTQRCIELFGRSRLHFLLFEDISLRRDAFCRAAQLAAGVDPLPADRFPAAPVNVGALDAPPIEAGLFAELRALYRPEVERLAALTALDVSPWGY